MAFNLIIGMVLPWILEAILDHLQKKEKDKKKKREKRDTLFSLTWILEQDVLFSYTFFFGRNSPILLRKVFLL